MKKNKRIIKRKVKREYKLKVYKYFTYTCVVDRLRLSSGISYLTTFVVLCNKTCVCSHAYITTTVDIEKHNSKQRILIF